MAIWAESERGKPRDADRFEDDDFPPHSAKGAGRPLIVLATVVLVALAVWGVVLVSGWFMR